MYLHYTCPYCSRDTTIIEPNFSSFTKVFEGSKCKVILNQNEVEEYLGIEAQIIICPNIKCKKPSLTVKLCTAHYDPYAGRKQVNENSIVQSRKLLPKSKAQHFPETIPRPLIEDYEEACLILKDSPKASATLSRRCLQGIIRDFHGINVKDGSLYKEIDELKSIIDSDLRNAIDAVRKIGNIGAHMKQDINVIVEVDEEEAGLLIGLIEMLFKEWYIAREKRKEHLSTLASIAKTKTAPTHS